VGDPERLETVPCVVATGISFATAEPLRAELEKAGAWRAQKPRIGPVTRSFFEFTHLLHLGGHDGESALSNGPDTCFVNIVRGE
jgi:hypothetical protein